jgi:hypothetical protein
MAVRKIGEPLKIGDFVKIRNYADQPGQIVERRGPLGQGGMRIYRVRLRRKPKPVYIELREDQLSLISVKA